MKPLDRIFDAARARQAHIILPEGQDPRVREAARIAVAEGLARITLMEGDAPGAERLDPRAAPEFDRLAEAWLDLRRAKGGTPEAARAAMADPIQQAAMRVRLGLADGTVGGPSPPPPTPCAPRCRSSAARRARGWCRASS